MRKEGEEHIAFIGVVGCKAFTRGTGCSHALVLTRRCVLLGD